eukprot:14805738-Alexandrium_andersonii.AAC.1
MTLKWDMSSVRTGPYSMKLLRPSTAGLGSGWSATGPSSQASAPSWEVLAARSAPVPASEDRSSPQSS